MVILKRLRLFIGLLFCAAAFAQYPANTANSGSGGGGVGDATKTAIQAGTYTYCSASAGDAYTCSLTPTLTAYTAGQCVVLDPDTTNTGAATLNIDALGVKDILGPFGSVLAAGDLPAGKMSTLCYNGTNWTKQGPSFLVQDATPTTGDTKLIVKAGAGQSGNLQEWQDAAGTTIAAVNGYGQFGQSSNGGNTGVYVITGDGDYLQVVGETMSMFVNPTGLTTNSGGVPAAFSIDTTQLNITNTTATTGATLVNIVAGAAQTTKSVVLQTGGRITMPLTTPTTSGETCTAGTFAADASYLYLCTSSNTWKRAALSAF